MSSMLEQAIIDAEALREAALKSAQQQIEEKYSSEIKEAMKVLLEEPGDELDLGDAPAEEGAPEADIGVDAPLSAEDGESLCACPDEDEPIMINIDFKELESAIDSEMGGDASADPSLAPEEEELASLQEEIELDELLVDEYLDEGCPYEEEEDKWTYPHPKEVDPLTPEEKAGKREEKPRLKTARLPTKSHVTYSSSSGLEEEESDLDKEFKELEEMLDVQTSGQPTGWQGSADSVMEYEEDLEKARLQSTELEEEKAELESANKDLTKENKKFRSAIMQMKEKLEEVNLSNARLLYTNRVISNDSLNERQRKRIVESIARADSIDEAKVIFETLQSAAGTETSSRRPKSLSEAVSRPSSIISARIREEKVNPYAERMKLLAGIKK